MDEIELTTGCSSRTCDKCLHFIGSKGFNCIYESHRCFVNRSYIFVYYLVCMYLRGGMYRLLPRKMVRVHQTWSETIKIYVDLANFSDQAKSYSQR